MPTATPTRPELEPQAVECDVRHRVTDALDQRADLEGCHILVNVCGHTATLTGRVRTWLQRDVAERAAAEAPGVREVENSLAVDRTAPGVLMDEIC